MISRDYIKDLTAAAIQWRKSDHSQSFTAEPWE